MPTVWEDEIEVFVNPPSPTPLGVVKRRLTSEDSQSNFFAPRSSPLVNDPSSSLTRESTDETLCGSPSKKARVSQTGLTPSVVSANGSSSSLYKEEINPFINQQNASLPPSSIFATPGSSNCSPLKSATEEVRVQGQNFIDAITKQMTKLENREKAAQQRGELFKSRYEEEKSNNEKLVMRVKELEAKVSE